MGKYSYHDFGIYQKKLDRELELTGVDRTVGIKIPIYMKELGLHHIDSRVNDKVNFIDPDEDNETYQTNKNGLFSHTWRNHSLVGRDRAVNMFENDGLSEDDLNKYEDNLMETA